MTQAMIAPKGPVALPKVRGREKIPEPTMDPTTMPVRANNDSFCTDAGGMALARPPMAILGSFASAKPSSGIGEANRHKPASQSMQNPTSSVFFG
jgi:hypothetical protein